MSTNQVKGHALFGRVLSVLLCCVMLFCLCQTVVFAKDATIGVTKNTDITNKLATANEGDTLTFELQQDIYLGQDSAKLDIKKGVTVVLTNASGKDVKILRHRSAADNQSRIDVKGALIIQETESGSLTIDGEGINHKNEPIIAVYGTGSSLTVNSGTITENSSYYGAIYSCDGANTTFNGGLFTNNINMDLFYGLGQGGVIYAANSNLTITGGTFKNNNAHQSGGVIYYDGRTPDNKLLISGGMFDGNKANSTVFGGAAVYIDCQAQDNLESHVEITGGVFKNNVAKGFGGAIYIQLGAVVSMKSIVVCNNSAEKMGGGIWNCPTGASNGYSFKGIYLAENDAGTAGADFFSEAKQSNAVTIDVPDYAFTGDYFNWEKDEASDRNSGISPEGSYYQTTDKLCAMQSGLTAANAPNDGVICNGNSGLSGGAIANNGMLIVGNSTDLPIEKTTTIGTADTFAFSVSLKKGGNGFRGNFVCKSSSGTKESVAFNSEGKAVITLSAGETKTFVDIPIGVEFEIVENTQNGWKQQSGTNTRGTIAVANEAAIFVNEPYTPTYGNLTVSKTVSGAGASTTQGFKFTVVLGDTAITGTYSDMTFTNGVAEFTLKHNENKTATGLPAGINYTVVETDSGGYTVSKKNSEGIITADKTITAEFVNTKQPGNPVAPPTGDTSDMAMWIALLLISGGVLLGVSKKRRKLNAK